ncbi:hypothetical protein [Leuconostoc citreum]
MMKIFIKRVSEFIQDWLSVILFILGIALIDIGAFYFNLIVGFLISGLLFIVMAVILSLEERRE